MQIEQRDQELAAIGSSIGCNCHPCVDHHVPKGRAVGLSERELAEAVATARTVRNEGIALLAPRIEEVLGQCWYDAEPAPGDAASRAQALAALGASVGVNSHPLLERQIAAALEFGLTATEVAAAIKTASYVQKRAGEITARKAKHALDQLAAVPAAGSRSQTATM